MGNHLVNRTICALLAEGENSENYEPEMTDGRVGDQTFYIRLNQCYQRSKDNSDDCEYRDPAGTAMRTVREQRNAEWDQTVGAHL